MAVRRAQAKDKKDIKEKGVLLMAREGKDIEDEEIRETVQEKSRNRKKTERERKREKEKFE